MAATKRKYSMVTNQVDGKYVDTIKKIGTFKDNAKKNNDGFVVYAVSSLKEHVKEHFPDLNLIELNKLYPVGSIGIRIYYGQENNQKYNYLVFTKPNSNPLKRIADDIIDKIYLVDGKFKIYLLSSDPHPVIHTNHHSCEPDCPDISIMNIM